MDVTNTGEGHEASEKKVRQIRLWDNRTLCAVVVHRVKKVGECNLRQSASGGKSQGGGACWDVVTRGEVGSLLGGVE